ncbi:hypothetical protein M408DRAFT_28930 [Serendipita vermifera MAFF 305830]|uniref:PNPLA domain-containing protein n=1 Tax=Serendipita vermifera MAFF 305830 TaxID=933852 RepID=A0A0C3AC39_SERVB|nr:hypothetical protein M408DRAFT_28930 [Serendipita vermifera MAFF 305830]
MLTQPDDDSTDLWSVLDETTKANTPATPGANFKSAPISRARPSNLIKLSNSVMNTQDEIGICIVSFDGGGPGTISQLRILGEIGRRLKFDRDNEEGELLAADCWDLMGGVGFGGLATLLLGCLRMTTDEAADEVATIGTQIFLQEADESSMRESNARKLKIAFKLYFSCDQAVF